MNTAGEKKQALEASDAVLAAGFGGADTAQTVSRLSESRPSARMNRRSGRSMQGDEIMEQFHCPRCHDVIIRPVGSSTLHSCGEEIAANENKGGL